MELDQPGLVMASPDDGRTARPAKLLLRSSKRRLKIVQLKGKNVFVLQRSPRPNFGAKCPAKRTMPPISTRASTNRSSTRDWTTEGGVVIETDHCILH